MDGAGGQETWIGINRAHPMAAEKGRREAVRNVGYSGIFPFLPHSQFQNSITETRK
jgi:hypothetical protein